jgi:hypothetical protein
MIWNCDHFKRWNIKIYCKILHLKKIIFILKLLKKKWCIGENIIRKNINLKKLCFKFSLYEIFWTKKTSLLKQNKHIGSLIHDFTQIAL